MTSQLPKIVLFIPNSRWFGKRPWVNVPYAALILTAILKNRYSLVILEANGKDLTEEQCGQELLRVNPDIVMVSGSSVEYSKQSHCACSISKGVLPKVPTVLGGVYPTTLPEETVKDTKIDWSFMYHAEERLIPFLELLLAKKTEELRRFPGIAFRDDKGALVEVPLKERIGHVQTMVKPDYSLFDLEPYLVQTHKNYQFNSAKRTSSLITSYGCPYNCVFCASRTISGRKVAFRPPEDVLEEIDFLVKEKKVEHLIILDDALLVKRDRLMKILNGLIERSYGLTWTGASVNAWLLDKELLEVLKKSGCNQLTISIESGSQRVLKEIIQKPLDLKLIPPLVKMCRDFGIHLGTNFVIGFPGETWDEIRLTCQFADECDFDLVHFHIATPLPRTDLYRICMDKGYLPADFSFLDPKFFGFGAGHITTDDFTPFELSVVRAFEWDRINFKNPERFKRVCELYLVTPEELNDHRRETRRKLGVHF